MLPLSLNVAAVKFNPCVYHFLRATCILSNICFICNFLVLKNKLSIQLAARWSDLLNSERAISLYYTGTFLEVLFGLRSPQKMLMKASSSESLS